LVTGESLAAVMLPRILTSLGIRGAGIAASGAVTLGVSLIAAFIVDQILDWIFDHKVTLINELWMKLDELKTDILEKVKQELEKFTEEREAVRQAALQSMLMAFKKQQ